MERRNTIQRDITLQAVRSLGNHATADEIYAYVSQEHPCGGRQDTQAEDPGRTRLF